MNPIKRALRALIRWVVDVVEERRNERAWAAAKAHAEAVDRQLAELRAARERGERAA